MSVVIENLVHVYNPGSPFESTALHGVDLRIGEGEFVGLIGHTGSGKSTLIQHMNGLLKASSGKIFVDGLDITAKDVSLLEVRKKVGLVFQYPEYQLFEETIYRDIAFGPSNLGLSEEEVHERVVEAMEMTGLDYEKLKDRSPFELSGGQKRRVAIAGVIAMRPSLLILDEPTAGLDPRGRDEILMQLKEIHKRQRNTVVLVSHSMEDISKLVDRIIVMNRGKIEFSGSPREIFRHEERLREIGLGVPKVVELMKALRERGLDPGEDCITIEEAKQRLLGLLRRTGDA
ncbi:MAG: energy-coupling factor transporter ATPase [Peptostreptococcaceae bacterium]|nr:energy-coupling factor transporter ATPase [Peptostreptococcaceae bacterium]